MTTDKEMVTGAKSLIYIKHIDCLQNQKYSYGNMDVVLTKKAFV